MSEPQDARKWLPCNDSPDDKAYSKVTVTVPPEYTIASNGLLNKVEKNADSWVYHWDSDEPIATYLIAINASKFHVFADTFNRPSNGEKVAIQYYVWDKDFNNTKTDSTEYNARFAFRQNVQMIDAFTKVYGDYPFKKYGLVALMPFGGGMEHQTITSFSRDWLLGDFPLGFAHELSHQWLGDKITCSSWKDIWINEGGAKFSEAVWLESLGDKQSYIDKILLDRQRYLLAGGSSIGRIWGQPVDQIFSYPVKLLTYEKGGWVYAMLRSMLGDTAFFPAMKSLLTKHAYQSISYLDFQSSFEEDIKNPLIPFDVFFRQWMLKPGHPVFKMECNVKKLGNLYSETTLTINQTQAADSVSDIFNVPVRVKFSDNNNNSFTDIFIQNQRTQEFIETLQFFPTRIEIDTTYILCEVPNGITDVKEFPVKSYYGNPEIFPNPVFKGTNGRINFRNELDAYVKIDINNELGQFVQSIYNGDLQVNNHEFSFLTNNLAPGVYFVRINAGTQEIIMKLLVME